MSRTPGDPVVPSARAARTRQRGLALCVSGKGFRAPLDESVPSLSSIVVLVELEGKRILLTGDALGDYVLDGLKAANLLDRMLHIDVLKVPHHGSNRKVEIDFFRRVTADHNVVSANGKYGNPDAEMQKMIADARRHDPPHGPPNEPRRRGRAARAARHVLARREGDGRTLRGLLPRRPGPDPHRTRRPARALTV